MRDYILITTVERALQHEEYYRYNRPMTHYVEQPEEIDSIFDNISYSKGIHV